MVFSFVSAYTDGRFAWPGALFATPLGVAGLRSLLIRGSPGMDAEGRDP